MTLLIKRGLFYLIILICLLLESCSIVLKTYVNNRYALPNNLEKRANDVFGSIANLKSLSSYDFELDISKYVIDTIIMGNFDDFNSSYITNIPSGLITVKVISHNTVCSWQQILTTINCVFDFKDKPFKSIQAQILVSSSPSLQGNKLYLNPNYEGIIIQKIQFSQKSSGKFNYSKQNINAFANNYLCSCSKEYRNYFLDLTPLLFQRNTSILNGAILISDCEIRFMGELSNNKPVSKIPISCIDFSNLSLYQEQQKFLSLYRRLQNQLQNISFRNFDNISTNNNHITLKLNKTVFPVKPVSFSFKTLNGVVRLDKVEEGISFNAYSKANSIQNCLEPLLEDILPSPPVHPKF